MTLGIRRITRVFAAGFVVAVGSAVAQPEQLSLQAPQSIAPSPHGFEAFEFAPNLGALRRAASEFSITLPGGQTVILERIATEDRGRGEFFWHGRVSFDLGSEVALTVKHGLVAGAIRTSANVYEIRPERGRHVIERQDRNSFPRGADPIAPVIKDTGTAALAAAPAAAGGIAEIHLMSLYTPQARDAAGGDANIEAQIQAAIDAANLAFTNSGVNAHYTLIHAGLASHDDTGVMGNDLSWVQTDPAVAALRDQHGADLVSLFVSNGGGGCGIGYVMRAVESSFAPYAFQVTDRDCAVGNLSFAHEHGHNIGMEHDPANGSAAASASYPWSFGHLIDGAYRTVMSYATACPAGCTRVAYFSNPNVSYLGQPTGIADQRDNARTASLTAPIVAGFRSSASTAPPAAPSGLAATAASSSQINLAWTDNSQDESGFLIERGSDGVTFAEIGSVGSNIAAYQNIGLTASTTYYYRVRATNGSGASAYTNIASASTPATQPLLAPTALTATAASATQINLAWSDNSTDETSFVVERSTDGVSYAYLATTAANTANYSSTGLTAGTTYFYRVRATRGTSNSAFSNAASATTTVAQPPAAPSGLAATSASKSQINLAWIDNSSDETSFLIERSADGVTFAQVASVAANVVSYANTGLSAATAYSYRVRAASAPGNSPYSNIALATTAAAQPPAPPSGLSASPASASQINLAWGDASSTETGFLIERSVNGGTFSQIASVGANVTSYSNSGLSGGTPYAYRVRAANGDGNSAYSGVASATTPAAPPATPSSFAAAALSAGTGKQRTSSGVRLTWTDNSANETSFQIDRCKVSGKGSNQTCTYAAVAALAGSATTGAREFVDGAGTFPSTNNAGTYRYRLTALAGTMSSAPVSTAVNVP